MVYQLFKRGLFSALWGILKGRFRQDYLDKLEEEAQKTSVYAELQEALRRVESDNRLLQIRVMSNKSTTERAVEEMKKQREYYQKQLARRDFILEEARQYVLTTTIQEVIDSKKIQGLENLVSHQRARINRDKNDFQNVLGSLLEKPPYRKIPIIIVHNQGHVYFQNAMSRLKVGDLKGRNLSDYLDCKNPNKQHISLGKKEYTAYVMPLNGGREFDYSAVYLKPASVFEKLKYATGKEMERAIAVIKAEMDAQLAKAGKKKPLRHPGS